MKLLSSKVLRSIIISLSQTSFRLDACCALAENTGGVGNIGDLYHALDVMNRTTFPYLTPSNTYSAEVAKSQQEDALGKDDKIENDPAAIAIKNWGTSLTSVTTLLDSKPFIRDLEHFKALIRDLDKFNISLIENSETRPKGLTRAEEPSQCLKAAVIDVLKESSSKNRNKLIEKAISLCHGDARLPPNLTSLALYDAVNKARIDSSPLNFQWLKLILDMGDEQSRRKEMTDHLREALNTARWDNSSKNWMWLNKLRNMGAKLPSDELSKFLRATLNSFCRDSSPANLEWVIKLMNLGATLPQDELLQYLSIAVDNILVDRISKKHRVFKITRQSSSQAVM